MDGNLYSFSTILDLVVFCSEYLRGKQIRCFVLFASVLFLVRGCRDQVFCFVLFCLPPMPELLLN